MVDTGVLVGEGLREIGSRDKAKIRAEDGSPLPAPRRNSGVNRSRDRQGGGRAEGWGAEFTAP